MSDTEEAASLEVPRPKRRRKWLWAGFAILALSGGGIAAGHYAEGAGLINLGLGGRHDPNRPSLVARDDLGFALTPEEQAADPRRFKASYYPIGKDFTSNLSDGESFVQVGLGVSTYYDERVILNLQRHEMAIRSAILMTLADQDPSKLATADGKRSLQKDLKGAVNEVLRAKEGFGGIDDVYFTSFVMQ